MLSRLRLHRVFAAFGLLLIGVVAPADGQEPIVPFDPSSPTVSPREFEQMLLTVPPTAGPRCMRSVPVSPNTDRRFMRPVLPGSGTIRRQVQPPCVPIEASLPAESPEIPGLAVERPFSPIPAVSPRFPQLFPPAPFPQFPDPGTAVPQR